MKKQSEKQPLRESLIKIGGRHLLKENKNLVFDYMEHLGPYLYQLRPNIKGWRFQVDRMAGSWEWTHSKFEDAVYATWGWEGKHEIPIESSDGDDCGTVKLKLKVGNPEDEKEMKVNAKKYLDTMRKNLPKIQKKLLEY